MTYLLNITQNHLLIELRLHFVESFICCASRQHIQYSLILIIRSNAQCIYIILSYTKHYVKWNW